MIQARVIGRIAALVGIGDQEVSLSDELEGEKLGMDSLNRIELSIDLEEEFDIVIEDEDFDRCVTVADVVALVKKEVEVAA